MSTDDIVAMLLAMESMSPLEYLAALIATGVVISFIVAWSSQSWFGAILRHETRILGWLLLGIPQILAGALLGLAARLLSRVSKRAERYSQRRAYIPAHA